VILALSKYRSNARSDETWHWKRRRDLCATSALRIGSCRAAKIHLPNHRFSIKHALADLSSV
jgi:hypothetical protein